MINHKFKANRPRAKPNTDIKPYWQVIKDIIFDSDILLEILDARMPDVSRNQELENLIKNSKKILIIILNKADLVSKNELKKIYRKIIKEYPCFIVSSKEKIGTKRLREFLIVKSKSMQIGKDIKIGILGYPNTGKSSIINAIAHANKAKVSSKAGTTHGQQWINITNNIKLIDSPGVIPLGQEDETRQALIASKNVQKIKNLDLVAHAIINLFQNKKNIESFYNVSIAKEDQSNPDVIIQIIGQKKGYFSKGGIVDINRTCIQIIRDWQIGKLTLK